MLTHLTINLPLLAVVLIALAGVAVMLLKRNAVKVLRGLSLVEAAVNLFLARRRFSPTRRGPRWCCRRCRR